MEFFLYQFYQFYIFPRPVLHQFCKFYEFARCGPGGLRAQSAGGYLLTPSLPDYEGNVSLASFATLASPHPT